MIEDEPAHFCTTLKCEEQEGGKRWKLLEPLVYFSAYLDRYIVIERGFECDGYSAPPTMLGAYMVRGIDRRPAFVHDKLYGDASVERKDADRVLLEAMEAVKVPWWRRRLIYRAVRVGGGFFYKGSVDEIVHPLDPESGA